MSTAPFGYGSLITESLRFAWRLKTLWIFGLFIGGGTGIQLHGHRYARPFVPFWIWPISMWPDYAAHAVPAILALVFAGFVVGLLLLALRVLSEGGLIHACSAEATGGSATLGEAWQVGLRKFLYVLGTFLAGALALAAVAALLIGFPVLVAVLIHPALGILIGFFTGTLFIAAGLFFFPFYAYSIRSAVLDAPSILSAWQTAFDLIRAQPGRTVLIALIRAAYKIVTVLAAVATFGVAGVLLLPILAVFWAIWPPIAVVTGLMLGFPILLVVSGFLGSAESYFWTLAYLWTRSQSGEREAPETPSERP